MKRYIFLLFLSFINIFSYAQVFSLETVILDKNDLTASIYQRNDDKGNPCALVKVLLASSNAEFKGNIVGDIKCLDGEYWIYTESGSQTLQINVEKNVIIVDFKKYVKTLQPKLTYIVKLSLPNFHSSDMDYKKQEKEGVLDLFVGGIEYSFIGIDGIRHYYTWTSEFQEGLCSVNFEGKQGVINRAGEIVIKPEYDEIGPFVNGIAAVGLNEKYGLINKKGEIVLPLDYDDVGDVNCDLVRVMKDGKYGFVDMCGNFVIPAIYSFAWDFDDGLALVYENQKDCSLINKNGKVVKKFTDNNYKIAGPYKDGLIRVEDIHNNKKHGFINKKGEIIIPLEYYTLHDFHEGVVIVRKDGKEGTLNKRGEIVIPFLYKTIGDFHNGIAYASIDGKCGYIGKDGTPIIPIEFDESYEATGDGMILLCKDGMNGFYDSKGNVIVPLKYEWDADSKKFFIPNDY